MKIPTSKIQFRKWLKSKEPNCPVGEPRRTCYCPLAIYYCEINNTNNIFSRSVAVDSAYVSYFDKEYSDYGIIKTKPWMNEFVKRVDKLSTKVVQASKALEILAEI